MIFAAKLTLIVHYGVWTNVEDDRTLARVMV